MGFFNFVKDVGEKFWDVVIVNYDKDDQVKKVQEYLNKMGIFDIDKVNV